MRKKLIFSLLALCCCCAFLVGCNKDEETTPTATAKTPIQLLNESVDTRITAVYIELGKKATNTDLSALANRVGTLEGQSAPDLSSIESRLEGLESLNISDSFSDILADIAFLKIQFQDIIDAVPTPSVTPTPTPTGATPTPTTIPLGILTKPTAISPVIGETNQPNGSVLFAWSDCNASVYEFWIGTNTNNMLLIDTLDSDVQSFLWPCPESDTYYFWRIKAIVGTTSKSSSFWFKTQ